MIVRFRNEIFFTRSRKSRSCAEAYACTPHKELRRLTPILWKIAIYGRTMNGRINADSQPFSALRRRRESQPSQRPVWLSARSLQAGRHGLPFSKNPDKPPESFHSNCPYFQIEVHIEYNPGYSCLPRRPDEQSWPIKANCQHRQAGADKK